MAGKKFGSWALPPFSSVKLMDFHPIMARLVEAEGDRDGLGGRRELEFAKQNLPGPAVFHRCGGVVAPEIGP